MDHNVAQQPTISHNITSNPPNTANPQGTAINQYSDLMGKTCREPADVVPHSKTRRKPACHLTVTHWPEGLASCFAASDTPTRHHHFLIPFKS
jgi:hypothetical protein